MMILRLLKVLHVLLFLDLMKWMSLKGFVFTRNICVLMFRKKLGLFRRMVLEDHPELRSKNDADNVNFVEEKMPEK